MNRRSFTGIAMAALSGAAFTASNTAARAAETTKPGDGWNFILPSMKEPEPPLKADVAALASRWLEQHEGTTADLGIHILSGDLAPSNGHAPLPFYIRTTSGAPWLTIGLKAPINASMSAQEITGHIAYVSNNGFPPPGLSVAHWKIDLLTPSTHIETGYRVTQVQSGHMTIALETQIFAIYGVDERVEIWADAPAPEFAYFQIREPLTIAATFDIAINGFD